MINKFTLLLLFFSMSLPLIMPATTTSSGEPDSLHIVKGVFDFPEITVSPSPSLEKSILLQDVEKVIDYDVSPEEPLVAAIIKGKNQLYRIVFWRIGDEKLVDCWNAPSGFIPAAIAWHPLGKEMFVIATKGTTYHIFRIDKKDNQWISKSVFSSPNQLKRLVICPRPFIISDDPDNEVYSYRIFFGMSTENKSFRTVSITENGDRFYQVIGPVATKTKEFPGSYTPPSEITADFALPLSFHPAGHELIWEDSQHHFNIATYNTSYWGGSKQFSDKTLTGGSITPTPNGLAFIHWQKDRPGIGLYFIKTGTEKPQLQDIQFIATPSSVPDGKGIVGLSKTDQGLIFSYRPIDIPLPDVQNAWMFAGSDDETDLFQKNYGLFRTIDNDQLYQLYDTENYACGDYDRTVPTRPYLVTTDIFWELYASAYEGIFIISERDRAIPNFWNFVDAANQYYQTKTGTSPWAPVFKALSDLHSGNQQNPEVARIIKADGIEVSDVLKKEFNYEELKPRSHYTATDEMKKYFMGFKYFTTAFDTSQIILEELNRLPNEIRNYAVKWVESYSGFIAPSRSKLIWKGKQNDPPSYAHYPGIYKTIFPLSWGFDNEVLYSTVYHKNIPVELQIQGPGGLRLLPSGLDLAATLGNGMAESILKEDFDKYPPLRKVINNLKANFKAAKGNGEEKNLYDKWINALSVQWTDTLKPVNNNHDRNLWQIKRLNTGLASWTTLRHATGLVNERTVAECGEAGFEAIILRAPRGYAEPDPYTFEAIADLFEATIKYLPAETSGAPDIHESYEEAKGSLYAGITKRLKEMAGSARTFSVIAEKERRGQVLSPEEYEEILYIGRIAEHCFLIFKSLSNPDYALSTPDPMSKIADVAGDRSLISYLHSAVGNPLEWDYVVPYYGRHEIVKGSVYSYYEFSSEKLLDDNEWRIKLKNQSFLPWISPYVTDQPLSYPASSGY